MGLNVTTENLKFPDQPQEFILSKDNNVDIDTIAEGDFVYLKCLVMAAMPLGTVLSNEPIEPDVVDLIPVDCDGNIIKRFAERPMCVFIKDILPVDKPI